MLKYFKGTAGFGLASIVISYLFLGGMQAAILVTILAVLEVSLSLDNAVVNAKKLDEMDDVWKARFLTWGMLIAVFGMRVLFPVLIVAVVAGISPWAAFKMAIYEPAQYACTLTSAHVVVAGFGMSFLSMVFLGFFFSKEKEVHWVSFIEKHLHHLEATEVAVTMSAAYIISRFIPVEEQTSFLAAAMMGTAMFILVEWLRKKLEDADEAKAQAAALSMTVVKAGLGAFIYLEILDASFSFDGVIGAFALTNNIFIIALGLGTGAFAVRGMTIMLVEKGTLGEFRFLEHGAFYAIGALAVLMGVGTFHEVPEIVTGGIGAAFIVLAIISSIVHKKYMEEKIVITIGPLPTEEVIYPSPTTVIKDISQVAVAGDNNLTIGVNNGLDKGWK